MDKLKSQMIADEVSQIILKCVESHGYGLKE
jgi:hypothetical protein